MVELAETARRTSSELIGAAVHKNKLLSAEGLAERAFTLAFSNLVYPQIWEDPVVDMEAMEINSGCRIVTIASGGCNMMSYLTASPEHITVVDLNTAHVALNKLKLAAARHLPSHSAFFQLFAEADNKANIALYDAHIRPHLDSDTRTYWDGREGLKRRRIERFTDGFYRYGLLGRFIATGHALARLHGVDPKRFLAARTIEEQREIFERDFSPLFDGRFVNWLISKPASLFGLGIPPAQYKALAGDHPGGIREVLRSRLRRLACDWPLADNYFAWQAFGRRYQSAGAHPPYLDPRHFATVRGNVGRVDVRHVSFTDHLAGSPDASLDRFVLLDAQDWMSDTDLNALWREITRTARPGARVIFRTAAEPSLLPGRVADDILARWRYEAERSARWTADDRSAIYGGFHLYVYEG